MPTLYPFQEEALKLTSNKSRCAFYYDMGLGKTFIGAEKLLTFPNKKLVICQKSKIDDWKRHFFLHYEISAFNLTKPDDFMDFLGADNGIGIINYDLVYRRPDLLIKNLAILLDESSLIQNEKAKRTKFIMNLSKISSAVILLSGTPISGKYEHLWSQCQILGWKISKTEFWNSFVKFFNMNLPGCNFPFKVVTGYKNVDLLKDKLAEYGALFKKSDEVFDLPEQNFNDVFINVNHNYIKFEAERIVTVEGNELVGDTTFSKLLGLRKLASYYSEEKQSAFTDLINSTEERIICFYNFDKELNRYRKLTDRPVSIVNGKVKDLSSYEEKENSITFIQYQAGAMGLNLQKANRIIYISPCLSSDLFEQSKKRIHRIGQSKPCFYYMLTCGIEKEIYETLNKRKDYTEELFAQKRNLLNAWPRETI